MAPLDAGSERALQGELAIRHGRHKCPCQPEILAYLAGRGTGITDLPWAVDKDDETSWEDEWRALLASAKPASDALDRKQLILWLRSRGAPLSGAAVGSGLALVALDALASFGVTVSDPAAVSGLESALSSKEAGDEQQQCEDALTAYLILTNTLPTDEQSSEWDRVVTSQRHMRMFQEREGRATNEVT